LEEYKIIELKKYTDERGFFAESFNQQIFDEIGQKFLQDNMSYSKKGVIRGMHYQWDKPMGKLVFCPHGEILDIIVDIRKDSPNLGKSYHFILNSESCRSLWVPPGFAHGFQVLSEEAVVTYKCSSYYNKEGESGINPMDVDLNLSWIFEENLLGLVGFSLSDKDKEASSFKNYCNNFKF
jgi:dTDP-4-dehydrorhamnose 3,5-epimerase